MGVRCAKEKIEGAFKMALLFKVNSKGIKTKSWSFLKRQLMALRRLLGYDKLSLPSGDIQRYRLPKL